jgi:hypothetical protein
MSITASTELSAEALATFPPLSMVIHRADGTQQVVTTDDPRAFLFDIRAARGERCTRTDDDPQAVHVLIVPTPSDWRPTSPLDLPPEFEIHREDSLLEAAAFAHRFNELEMADALGWWAVGPTNRVGEQSFDIGATAQAGGA